MSNLQDHDNSNDDSAAEMENNFKILDEMNIDKDFNVWGDFRKSVSLKKESLKSQKSQQMKTSVQSISESDAEEIKEDESNRDRLSVAFSALTPDEKRDIRAWNMRLTKDTVFSRYYFPEQWELREMTAVAESLELKDPRNSASYLDHEGHETTKRAVASIFFPGDHDPKSVLLKRGPILSEGEEERELMLLTHGFVMSRIEFDSLLSILFMINSENPQYLRPAKLRERFDDIDTDQSGSIDRCELKEVFTRLGVPVSEQALSHITERCDTNNDGTIDVNEFISEMQSQLKPKKTSTWDSLSSWAKDLGGTLVGTETERKLDCAYLFSDVEKVESINICSSESTKALANSSWADQTFAVFVKGKDDPMLMVCSKPEQRLAWVDAFRVCFVKSTQMKADSGFEAAKKILPQIGWQHKKVRASLFSLVVCNDLGGLIAKVSEPTLDIDIDEQDEYHGYTALHYAVVLDNMQCADLLLRYGAQVNLYDNNQKTPGDHAMLAENKEMIRLLKRFGAKRHTPDVLFKEAIEEQQEMKRGQPQSRGKEMMPKAKGATGAMSDAMSAMRERGEKIETLDNKTSQLHDGASNYADMAKMVKEKNKKKAGFFGMVTQSLAKEAS
eukprot:CAMPEP_0196136728 /NCGR_PEP_ID=MMETSP0910-20130528/4940_1 /TAXON_ID=49265 /ORGANISM="Thalassiosira rotula, Strain GSO102" /LENGTH=614 /DNA_ID=CAMNT_0041397063 /DNA_START=35 /DNA_END=1879 /DNA_ORIENTATION=+